MIATWITGRFTDGTVVDLVHLVQIPVDFIYLAAHLGNAIQFWKGGWKFVHLLFQIQEDVFTQTMINSDLSLVQLQFGQSLLQILHRLLKVNLFEILFLLLKFPQQAVDFTHNFQLLRLT